MSPRTFLTIVAVVASTAAVIGSLGALVYSGRAAGAYRRALLSMQAAHQAQARIDLAAADEAAQRMLADLRVHEQQHGPAAALTRAEALIQMLLYRPVVVPLTGARGHENVPGQDAPEQE